MTIAPAGTVTLTSVQIDHEHREYAARPPTTTTLWQSERQDGWLHRQVDSGAYVADGTEVVEGRELLRFVPRPSGVESFAEAAIWADPETFRPVKLLHAGGCPVEFTEVFSYLPRTPENLALLEVTIPDGYTTRDSLLGHGPVPPPDRTPDYYDDCRN